MSKNQSEQPAPFIIATGYPEANVLRFGVWNPETEFYVFPNGDQWPLGFAKNLIGATLVTQWEVEQALHNAYVMRITCQ